jgi:hypothetical protein
MSFESITQIIEGLLPASYSAGDSVVSYYGTKTAELPFYVNLFKFVFILMVIVYIGYLLFYKGERERLSDNRIDFALLVISLSLTSCAIYFSYQNVKKERDAQKLNQEMAI